MINLFKRLLQTKENTQIRCVVVGLQYYNWETVKPFVIYDEAVMLRREPDNKHDKWAIAVYYNDMYKIGYVRKEDNREVLPGLYSVKVIKTNSIIIERID